MTEHGIEIKTESGVIRLPTQCPSDSWSFFDTAVFKLPFISRAICKICPNYLLLLLERPLILLFFVFPLEKADAGYEIIYSRRVLKLPSKCQCMKSIFSSAQSTITSELTWFCRIMLYFSYLKILKLQLHEST